MPNYSTIIGSNTGLPFEVLIVGHASEKEWCGRQFPIGVVARTCMTRFAMFRVRYAAHRAISWTDGSTSRSTHEDEARRRHPDYNHDASGSVRRHIVMLTAAAGGLAGLGLISLAHYAATSILGYNNAALAASTATVIGGTALKGGPVRVLGTVWGAALAGLLLGGSLWCRCRVASR